MPYRHLPENKFKLSEQIDIKDNQILSMGIGSFKTSDFRLFSFSKDEEVKQEIYPLDTLYICLEGKLLIEKENNETLEKDEAIIIKQGVSHKLIALENTKILEIKTGD